MWEKFKKKLLSEDGMKIVNMLFLLLILIRSAVLAIIVFTAWIAFLWYCAKHTKSKSMKGIYIAFIGFAGVLILVYIYALTAI